ncbi:MAG: hypothetical protein RIC16_01495 [Rhodospirillales bacterium]
MRKIRHRGPLPGNLREVLFEFRHVGTSLRVSAIDPDTLTEVTLVADPRTSEEELKRVAARKLHYVIQKKRQTPKPEY